MADNLLDKASILLTPTAYNDGGMLSVKPENGDGDFTFSRSSAATRVNAQGLVENVQILSPELVSNGNFSQIGTEEVSNGNFSQEGSELITNGNFATDTGWNKQSGWVITNGYAESTALNTRSIYQNIGNAVVGKTYKITYTILETNGGNFKVVYGGVNGTIRNTTGTYIEYFKATSSADGTLYFDALNVFIGKIDNVSVKEVGQDWTISSGASLTSLGAKITHSPTAGSIAQLSVLDVGKQYKITYEITENVAGGLKINSAVDSSMVTTVGTHTKYFEADLTSLSISRTDASNNDVTITNISVKEVGQDWSRKDGKIVSVDSSGLVFDNSTGNASGGVFQNLGLSDTKKYRMTATMQLLTGSSNGTFTLFSSSAGGTGQSGVYSGSVLIVGGDAVTETFDFSPASGDVSIQFTCDEANATYKVSNVSVKEITDDTDLPRINYEGFSYQDSLGSEEVVNGGFDTDSSWGKLNATISDGKATVNIVSGAYSYINQSESFTSGKKYKLTAQVKGLSGSNAKQIRFRDNSANTGGLNVSNGTVTLDESTQNIELEWVANSNSVEIIIERSTSAGDYSFEIDNVSVKEVLGQEVVPDSGCGSWLLEPQSTNLIPYSEDFSNITDYALTVTDNSTISPENINNGTSLVPSTVNTVHYLTFPNTSTGTVTFTVYAKANGYNYIFLHLYDGSNGRAWFNLDTGVVGTKDSSVTSEMIAMTNGWYRCSVTRVLSGSLIQADIAVSNADNATTFSGNGTSGIFIYGAQLEQQSYATSYIPTNGATSTRLQDIANNSGNSTLINSTEGVLYAEIAALADDGTNRRISLVKNAINKINLVLSTSSNTVQAIVISGGAVQFIQSFVISDTTEFNKIAIKYKVNDFSLWINGVEVATGTSGNTFSSGELTTLRFDNATGTNPFHGKTKALAVYKEELTDAQLQSLTTI